MATPAQHLAQLLDALRAVLEDERSALLSGTAEAINEAARRKTLVAEMLEQLTDIPSTPRPDPQELIPLMRYNQENAVICDAMLRHLTGAVDKLRRRDPHRSYKADGTEENWSPQHALGAA
jgi:flagellar biosynthesis/type III secretory pathway chaperone